MTTLLHPPLPSAAEPHWRWHGVHGSARALALAEAAGQDTRPWVFIAADVRELERLAAELRFFSGASLPILTLLQFFVAGGLLLSRVREPRAA